ncbi:hypothetical protein QE152_g37262 [Popillia japonica]|uniref:PiggyBac transposable element-derived protein domain-containing protein n=1 Tax=Popillia japonica TaxID=7064 RepID=A0AAW1IB00_POPJA
MANNPDKFGIKFWLTADVKAKYLMNRFPFVGKDDQRPKNLLLGNGDKKMPETVKFYNETAFGVDVLDQMARQYSTKSASRRWRLFLYNKKLFAQCVLLNKVQAVKEKRIFQNICTITI